MKQTTIRVGQRLMRWDGVHAHDAPLLVEWADGESAYLTLDQCETEGGQRGKGMRPWAR